MTHNHNGQLPQSVYTNLPQDVLERICWGTATADDEKVLAEAAEVDAWYQAYKPRIVNDGWSDRDGYTRDEYFNFETKNPWGR
jgi:hypothetical protein